MEKQIRDFYIDISKSLDWTEEKYVEECMNSFRSHLDTDQFFYGMEGDSFVIKKRLQDKKSVKVKLANILLERVS